MRSWQQKNKRADWFIVLSVWGVWGVYSDCLRVVCLIFLTLSTISCYSVKPPWPTVSFYILLGWFLATDHLVFQTYVHFQKIEGHIPKWPIFPAIKGPLLIGDWYHWTYQLQEFVPCVFGYFRFVRRLQVSWFFRILPAWQGILESRDLKTTIFFLKNMGLEMPCTTTYAEKPLQSQHKPNCLLPLGCCRCCCQTTWTFCHLATCKLSTERKKTVAVANLEQSSAVVES